MNGNLVEPPPELVNTKKRAAVDDASPEHRALLGSLKRPRLNFKDLGTLISPKDLKGLSNLHAKEQNVQLLLSKQPLLPEQMASVMDNNEQENYHREYSLHERTKPTQLSLRSEKEVIIVPYSTALPMTTDREDESE
jgi:hypothetical protein